MRSTAVLLGLLVLTALPASAQRRPVCLADNAGLTLRPGFCALIVADNVGRARHIVAAPNGDLFVSISGPNGGILALRDTSGDGFADVQKQFSPGQGGGGLAMKGNMLFFAPNDAVVRYRIPTGSLVPDGPPDTVVTGLPTGGHTIKTLAFGPDGALFVNIGSRSNSCQVRDRTPESPGQDPCGELGTRAGIWRFDPNKSHQTQADGRRWATGLRNTVAITQNPADGQVYGAVHGRDGFFNEWGKLYTADEQADLPSEMFVRLGDGDDYGWPYCYWDQNKRQYLLNPEYGGDKQVTGRCGSLRATPLLGFPGHWAPNGSLFYTGSQFPAVYRAGVFIAFHGSWNRAPKPQEGSNVVFAPLPGNGGVPKYEVFADNFSTTGRGQGANHRPVGLAQGPDGSLYVTDDANGRIYRIIFTGPGR